MNRPLQFTLLATACALLTGCQEAVEDDVLSIGDSGKTVTLAVGESLSIHLDGNPTTGYQWLQSPDSAPNEVVEVQIDYQSDPNPSGMTGVGGSYVIGIQAAEPGKAQLQFGYRREWEKEEPDQEFSLTVIVKE